MKEISSDVNPLLSTETAEVADIEDEIVSVNEPVLNGDEE